MAKRTKFQIHMKTALRFAKKVGVKNHKRAFKLAAGTWTKATATREGHAKANWKSVIQKAAKSGGGSHSSKTARRSGSKTGRKHARRGSGGGGIGSRLDSVGSFLGNLGRRPHKKRGRGKPRKDSYSATKVKLARIIKNTEKAQQRLERIEDRRVLTQKEKAEKKAAAAANKAAKTAHKEVSAAQKADFSGYTNRGPAYPQHGADDGDRHIRSDGDPDRRRKRKGKKSKKRSSAKRSSKKSSRSGGKRRVSMATRAKMSRAAKARHRRDRAGKKARKSSTGRRRKKSGKAKKRSSRDFSRFY